MERVKILHNKRSAALVQMQTPEMAEHAVNEQHLLNRIGAEIYVNYSNKVTEIRTPAEKGMPDDGLTKDFTYPLQPPPRHQQGATFFGGGGGNSYGDIAVWVKEAFQKFAKSLFLSFLGTADLLHIPAG